MQNSSPAFKLKQLDLCSGVGCGFPLAGVQTGQFELIGLSEIDEWCSGILAKRYPGVTNWGDARSLRVREIRRQWSIDIITASPPCQPFSVQGKRRGSEDPRDCFPAVKRAIESIRPRYFCIENVPGLLSCKLKPQSDAFYLYRWLKQLARLGYDAEWLVCGSGHFAAPFRRERLLLVGIAKRDEQFWERATPWPEQARGAVEKARAAAKNRGIEPGFLERFLQSPQELPRPLGVQSRNSTVRRQREAIGNALDPRVAQIALERVLYLDRIWRQSEN